MIINTLHEQLSIKYCEHSTRNVIENKIDIDMIDALRSWVALYILPGFFERAQVFAYIFHTLSRSTAANRNHQYFRQQTLGYEGQRTCQSWRGCATEIRHRLVHAVHFSSFVKHFQLRALHVFSDMMITSLHIAHILGCLRHVWYHQRSPVVVR